MIKVSADPIMCRIEGPNGSCYVMFSGGEAFLYNGNSCYPCGRLVNTRNLESFLNLVLQQVGPND